MKKITAILLVLVSVFCLSACHAGDIKLGIYAPYWNFWKYSKGSSFTYSASEIAEIDINWVGGEIEIVSSDAQTLSITENSEELSDDAKMHYYINEGKLTIHYSKSMLKEDIDVSKKHLRVEVPEGIEIDIDSVNADIQIGEMVLGELKLTNVSGKVKFASLACNEINIENVDGDVSASEIVADEFSANSVSGAVNIYKISANEISVQTVSGKTSLGIAKKSMVKLNSVSGNIDISLPDDIGATVEFSTMSGNFSSDMPHTTSKKTYTFGKGIIEIDAETVSGSLHIS